MLGIVLVTSAFLARRSVIVQDCVRRADRALPVLAALGSLAGVPGSAAHRWPS